MGGIGSVVKAERPDLKTLKIWYALLFSDSDEVKRAVSFNLDNIKRIYGTLDDFNGRLKRHIRSGPVFQTSLLLSHLERVRQPLLPVPHTGFLKHPRE